MSAENVAVFGRRHENMASDVARMRRGEKPVVVHQRLAPRENIDNRRRWPHRRAVVKPMSTARGNEKALPSAHQRYISSPMAGGESDGEKQMPKSDEYRGVRKFVAAHLLAPATSPAVHMAISAVLLARMNVGMAPDEGYRI